MATTTVRDIRFLPPLDNLLWRRSRIADLFSFEYKWEIYTPAVKRTYGYYAMPILAGAQLIGRVDSRIDRKRGILTVDGLHLESTVRRTKQLDKTLRTALERFGRAHGANQLIWTTTALTNPGAVSAGQSEPPAP